MSPPRRRMTPEELLRSKVGANVRRSLRRLWAGDMEFAELCDAVQPSEASVQRAIDAISGYAGPPAGEVASDMTLAAEDVLALAKEMGLGERVEPECYLPSQEEIRMASARIRSEWSQDERDARRSGRPLGRLD